MNKVIIGSAATLSKIVAHELFSNSTGADSTSLVISVFGFVTVAIGLCLIIAVQEFIPVNDPADLDQSFATVKNSSR